MSTTPFTVDVVIPESIRDLYASGCSCCGDCGESRCAFQHVEAVMKEDDFRLGLPGLGIGSRDGGGRRELSHRVLPRQAFRGLFWTHAWRRRWPNWIWDKLPVASKPCAASAAAADDSSWRLWKFLEGNKHKWARSKTSHVLVSLGEVISSMCVRMRKVVFNILVA